MKLGLNWNVIIIFFKFTYRFEIRDVPDFDRSIKAAGRKQIRIVWMEFAIKYGFDMTLLIKTQHAT